MTKVLDHGEVELIEFAGGDKSVLRSMLVSTGKDDTGLETVDHYELFADHQDADDLREEVKKNKGRINYLMREKHGTPFEHNFFCFRITAPIFVIREWHRHRIGWSYNEQSGRYMELGDKFYVPAETNVRKRVGKPGAYRYEYAGDELAVTFSAILEKACEDSYGAYKAALDQGVAPEQARLFLHVNHYSSFYASCNARSLMHFLALRNSAQAQWEIREYAKVLESCFAEKMPVTYEAFVTNNRVAP